MYQWTLHDAWLPIVLAAVLFFITVGTLLFAEASLLVAARRTHAEQNPALKRQSMMSTRRPSLSDDSESTYAADGAAGPRGIHSKGMWTPVSCSLSCSTTSSDALRYPQFAPYRPMAAALYQQYRRPLYTFWLFPILFAVFAKVRCVPPPRSSSGG